MFENQGDQQNPRIPARRNEQEAQACFVQGQVDDGID